MVSKDMSPDGGWDRQWRVGTLLLPARIEKIIFSRTAEMPKREKALIESAFFLAIFEYVPIVQDTFLDTILGNSRTLLFLLIFLLLLRPPYSNIFPNDIAFL